MTEITQDKSVQISPETLPAITWEGARVITTDLLARLYETEEIRIQQNYLRNQARFEQGKHFHKVTGKALQNLRLSLSEPQISTKTRNILLWTERGAARHAKMLETDAAWDVFEKLEDCYFTVKEALTAPQIFITAAQAGELSALMAERFPEGKDRPYAWSRFNNHFRIARYRELPAERFAEACAYIGSMQRRALPAPNLSAEALAAARKLALDYFDAIRAGEKNPRVDGIPEEVLTGIVSDMLMNNRYLLSFDPFSGRLQLNRVDPRAFVVTPDALPGVMRESLSLSTNDLFDIQAACLERLRSKVGAMEEALFIQRQKLQPLQSPPHFKTRSNLQCKTRSNLQ